MVEETMKDLFLKDLKKNNIAPDERIMKIGSDMKRNKRQEYGSVLKGYIKESLEIHWTIYF